MDAKSRANFINSVAGGQNIPCPQCGTLNEDDAKFCAACGTPLKKKAEEEIPFMPVKKPEERKPAAEPVKPVIPMAAAAEESGGPESAVAGGLPGWDIGPPQMMVRRKRK